MPAIRCHMHHHTLQGLPCYIPLLSSSEPPRRNTQRQVYWCAALPSYFVVSYLDWFIFLFYMCLSCWFASQQVHSVSLFLAQVMRWSHPSDTSIWTCCQTIRHTLLTRPAFLVLHFWCCTTCSNRRTACQSLRQGVLQVA